MARVEQRSAASSVEDLLKETDDLVGSYILRGQVPPAALVAWRIRIRLSEPYPLKSVPEKHLQ